MQSTVLLLVACLLGPVGAVELTKSSWAGAVKGKTVFVKFHAPWWGHCKSMKPDWDKLMAEFKDSPSVLVADVDCEGTGKSLCDMFKIRSFPTMKYGDPNDMQNYKSGRSFAELNRFASGLGSVATAVPGQKPPSLNQGDPRKLGGKMPQRRPKGLFGGISSGPVGKAPFAKKPTGGFKPPKMPKLPSFKPPKIPFQKPQAPPKPEPQKMPKFGQQRAPPGKPQPRIPPLPKFKMPKLPKFPKMPSIFGKGSGKKLTELWESFVALGGLAPTCNAGQYTTCRFARKKMDLDADFKQIAEILHKQYFHAEEENEKDVEEL